MVWVKPSMRDEEDLVTVNIVDRHDHILTFASVFYCIDCKWIGFGVLKKVQGNFRGCCLFAVGLDPTRATKFWCKQGWG